MPAPTELEKLLELLNDANGPRTEGDLLEQKKQAVLKLFNELTSTAVASQETCGGILTVNEVIRTCAVFLASLIGRSAKRHDFIPEIIMALMPSIMTVASVSFDSKDSGVDRG